MLLPLPLVAAFQLAAAVPPRVYDGRAGKTTVAIPKMDADVVIDGNLDEPVWRQAAVLTGWTRSTKGIARLSSWSTR
jgi:hypothetical protein